jgi:NAD(P)-dependent dehydrogenase (short-subunit alcohol dehydrogenase family)
MDPADGPMQALVVGAAGGIGAAVVERFARDARVDRVWAVTRTPEARHLAAQRVTAIEAEHTEAGIAATLGTIKAESPRLTRVVIALGALHGDGFAPEKSLDALQADTLTELYRLNCVLPLLWVAGVGREWRRSPDCRIAVLSARVGSTGDNHLGGWYAYRCAKAALNMGLKSAAIELARRGKGLKLIAYHPGTVDTALSKPFQKNVPDDRLFTPAFTADRLAGLLDDHPADGVLSFVDYDGRPLPW